MTTLEAMALAVLKGDLAAARALADSLREEYGEGGIELPPVRKITASPERLRVVAHFPLSPDIEVDDDSVKRGIVEWLTGKTRVLGLVGCERFDLYEFPEKKR
jgi:hypothetical protein